MGGAFDTDTSTVCYRAPLGCSIVRRCENQFAPFVVLGRQVAGYDTGDKLVDISANKLHRVGWHVRTAVPEARR